MKKKFTLWASCLLACGVSWAGTPVIDGVFDGEAVWGAPVAVGNGSPGWHSATNAKRFYVTYDPNYVYFCGEFTASWWQQFMFLVNTKPGGGRADAPTWGRQFAFNHTNAPDFIFRGDIGNTNYMEFHIWDGTAWTGTGTNRNDSRTEGWALSGGSANDANGFVEIRVPRTTIGEVGSLDVQFVISGNNNTHGNFDSVPQDNVMTGWGAPDNFTSISNYASSVVLPATLGSFGGEVRLGSAQLSWQTLTETNVSHFEVEQSPDARLWNTVGRVTAGNLAAGGRYQFTKEKFVSPRAFFRLKVIDKDGSFAHSKMVMLKSGTELGVEIIGNPVKSAINVAIHNPQPETINAALVDINGRRVGQVVYKHPGGSSVLQMQAPAGSAGIYLLQLQGEQTKGVYRIMKQ
jgi:hypothetical protein